MLIENPTCVFSKKRAIGIANGCRNQSTGSGLVLSAWGDASTVFIVTTDTSETVWNAQLLQASLEIAPTCHSPGQSPVALEAPGLIGAMPARGVSQFGWQLFDSTGTCRDQQGPS